jgi:hypothetical protein
LPAINELNKQQIISPSSITKFSTGELHSEVPALLNYLVRHLNILEKNAFDLVSVFCSDIKNDLEAGSIVSWKGLGKLGISTDGVLVFENQYQHDSSNQDLGNTTSTALNYNYHQDDVEDSDTSFNLSNKVASTYTIDFKTSIILLISIVLVFFVIRYTYGSFNLLDSRYDKVHLINPPSTYQVK